MQALLRIILTRTKGLQAREGAWQLPAVGADGVAGTEPDVYMVDEHGDEGMPGSWLAGMYPAVLQLRCCCIIEELC